MAFPRSVLRGLSLAVQVLITGPYAYQRIFLHFALPVLFSGVCSMFYAIMQSTPALAVLGVVLGLSVALSARHLYSEDSTVQAQVVPVVQCDSSSTNMEVPTFRTYEPETREHEQLDTSARAGRSASKSSLGSSDLEIPSPPTSYGSGGSVRSGNEEPDHAVEKVCGDNNSNNSSSDVEEVSSEDWPVSSEDESEQVQEEVEKQSVVAESTSTTSYYLSEETLEVLSEVGYSSSSDTSSDYSISEE